MAKRSKKAIRRATVAQLAVFPKHLRCDTPEEWRQIKRQEWREVMDALRRFAYGSAYVPGQTALYRIQKDAESFTEMIEAQGWVAWP